MTHMKWSADKAELWMRTENPFLGGASPNLMIEKGRGHKVLRFVETAIDDAQESDGDWKMTYFLIVFIVTLPSSTTVGNVYSEVRPGDQLSLLGATREVARFRHTTPEHVTILNFQQISRAQYQEYMGESGPVKTTSDK